MERGLPISGYSFGYMAFRILGVTFLSDKNWILAPLGVASRSYSPAGNGTASLFHSNLSSPIVGREETENFFSWIKLMNMWPSESG